MTVLRGRLQGGMRRIDRVHVAVRLRQQLHAFEFVSVGGRLHQILGDIAAHLRFVEALQEIAQAIAGARVRAAARRSH